MHVPLRAETATSPTSYRSAAHTADHDLRILRWIATFAPAVAVFFYESARHEVFEHTLHVPDLWGNFATGIVALTCAYLFAKFVFDAVGRIQAQSIEESRTSAALSSMITERERLSRELHDGLAQATSYVLVRLDTVRNLVETGKYDSAVRELEHLRAAMDDVNNDVRESIAGLRSQVAERGIWDALADYLEAFEERSGIQAELRLDGEPHPLAANASLQLFRVVQEALTNVRKHARATQVRVGVNDQADSLELIVADNGVGFDLAETASRTGSYGLESMRERVESLGGTLEVLSKPPRGTQVIIRIPRGSRP